MYLKIAEMGNGYACACCRQEWDEIEWVETYPIFDMLYLEAMEAKAEGYCAKRYEKDGKLLHGYYSYIGKKDTQVYMVFGGNANGKPDREYCIRSDDGSKAIVDRKNLNRLYEEYLMEKEV